MNESLCILVRRAPYGTIHAAEAFRHFAGASSSGLKVMMILVDDGIYMAKKNQEAESFGWTSLSQLVNMFLSARKEQDLKIYIHTSSLNSRGIGKEKLIKGIELIDDRRLVELMGKSQSVMLF